MTSNNVSSAQSLYLATGGTGSTAPLLPIVQPRDPLPADLGNEAGLFQTGQWWVNSVTTREFYLDGFNSAGGTVTSNWVQLASTAAGVNQLIDNHSVSAFPTLAGAITIAATAPIDTNTSPNTITVSVGDASDVAKGVVQLDTVAQFPDDASNTKAATPSYVNAKLGPQDVHQVLLGGGGAGVALGEVATAGNAGQPLLSKGGALDPDWGTLGVPYGGTGDNTISAFAPVCGGTTNVNPLQSATTNIGNAGWVLTSTGAASLPTWQDAPGTIKSIVRWVKSTAGNYNFVKAADAPNMVFCDVEVVGAGGGGGGGDGGANPCTGVGGGGGGYAKKSFTTAQIAASVAVTVGAGGAGGAAGNNGTAGGTTSFTFVPVLQATGGAGGTRGATNLTTSAGGVGTNGDVNTHGGLGIGGINLSPKDLTFGGSTYFGGGAALSIGGVPSAGLSYGGGGSGGIPSGGGAAGADGAVIITAYCA